MKTKEWVEATDASGVPLYNAADGHLCQDLLPPEVRASIEHIDAVENAPTAVPVAEVKLFTPDGPFTWYVAAFDGDDTHPLRVRGESEPPRGLGARVRLAPRA